MQLYYVNSRYYDHCTGRWISPEPNVSQVVFDTKHSFLGYNLYSYCFNNPVNFIDHTGQWTFSINFSLFAGFGGGYSVNIGLSFDSEDMLAFQLSYSVPNNGETRNTVIGASAGAGINVQYTDLNNVSKLEGPSKSVGVNAPAGGYDIIKNDKNENIGWSAGIGPSAGRDFHVNETKTYTIGSPFSSFIKLLKDWFGL